MNHHADKGSSCTRQELIGSLQHDNIVQRNCAGNLGYVTILQSDLDCLNSLFLIIYVRLTIALLAIIASVVSKTITPV
jgi:hypothetical protein